MSSDGLVARAQEIASQAAAEAKQCDSPAELEELRVRYLGRKGELTQLLRGVRELPAEERPATGEFLNRTKQELAGQLAELAAGLAEVRSPAAAPGTDPTLPGRRPLVGRLHPLTQVTREILDVFRHLGFAVWEGPEVETEYYNFEALNMPAWHPCRDEQDSFFLRDGVVLRTHTSPVQIRVMESHQPPVRVVAPGRCFRRDNPDASHAVGFHQVEGLYVDEGVSLADLKGTLEVFAREVFGPTTEVRFRPSYFPFTEPSAEMDVRCVVCGGEGCRVCSHTGWLEIMGCGMVHPEVFRAVKYDPEEVSGFAFGMGIDRVTMLRYRIDDIRLFMENDIRFLEQF